MRLCHVVPSLEEQYGGPSKSVHALCAALAREGSDVDLLATTPKVGNANARVSTQIEGRLRTRLFPRDWPQRLCPSAGLRHALDTVDSEVIHHHSIWLRTLHYAHRRAAKSGAKFVLSPRGMMSTWAWRHHSWRKIFARACVHPGALAAVDGWHATSEDEEREIRALGFKQPVCVAPNAVDAPTPDAVAAAVAHWQAACPEVASRPVALFYSRFHPKKRVIELIDLWIEHAPADWLLLLVGIPQAYTPDMLERYAAKISGAGRVRAFSGVGQPPPYPVASLFVLPSHSENFGLVVAEAMAHALPVLVTDTTPWREVARRELGWCVAWENFKHALHDATAESLTQLRHRGARAREWVLRDFSWDRSAAQLTAFYATLKGSAR